MSQFRLYEEAYHTFLLPFCFGDVEIYVFVLVFLLGAVSGRPISDIFNLTRATPLASANSISCFFLFSAGPLLYIIPVFNDVSFLQTDHVYWRITPPDYVSTRYHCSEKKEKAQIHSITTLQVCADFRVAVDCLHSNTVISKLFVESVAILPLLLKSGDIFQRPPRPPPSRQHRGAM